MCLDMVIRNGMPVTFMLSTERVTFLYWCMIDTGMLVFSTLTFGDICLAVFPFTHPRSGPQMNSAFVYVLYVDRAVGYHVHIDVVNVITSARPPDSSLQGSSSFSLC